MFQEKMDMRVVNPGRPGNNFGGRPPMGMNNGGGMGRP